PRDDRLRAALRARDSVSRLPLLRRLPQQPPAGCGGMSELILYTRPGCHLCEQALEGLVAPHRGGSRFERREIDIESDETLLRRMLERIPVLESNGRVISELTLDQTSVRAWLDTV